MNEAVPFKKFNSDEDLYVEETHFIVLDDPNSQKSISEVIPKDDVLREKYLL